ncbi:MAG: glycosyltransferase family 4 protein [Cyclobacteriaceae bacterium]
MKLIVFPVISFLIAFLFLPVVIKLLGQWKLFDSPGEHKIHSTYTPSMGGIAILLGAALSLLMGLPLQQWLAMKFFFIALLIMFLIGLRDDVLALSPRQKLFSQFLPIVILVVLDQTNLTSFYGFLSEAPLPTAISWLLTFFVIVIVSNAYNLIDGVDGLAGTVGVVALGFFGIWFWGVGDATLSLIALCFVGSLLAFLVFNWQPSKIFMGDTGALTVGLLLVYFAIKFINSNFALPAGHAWRFESSVSTAVCVLIVPLFDTLRVIIIRLRKLQSPFRADRNHLHHQFLQLGFSHSRVVLVLALINLIFLALAWVMKDQGDWLILSVVLAVCLAINFGLKAFQQRVTPVEHERANTTAGTRSA